MLREMMSKKNSPMLVKLFITITLFLIIPLTIVGFIFNVYLVNYSEREISKSVITNLKTIKSLNDVLVDSISRDIIRFSLNTTFDDLKGINDYNSLRANSSDLFKLYNVRNALRSAYNSNFRLQSIYVYQEAANYILTSGEEGVVAKSDFSDMDWLKTYNEKKDTATGTIWLNSRQIKLQNFSSNPNGVPINVITFILPLKNLSLQMDGAVVFNLNENELSRLINNTEFNNNGYVFIMDNSGNVISHIDKKLVSTNIKDKTYVDKIINSNSNSGYIIENVNNKKQLIAYNKTEFNDWIYVGVFSLDNLMNNTNTLRIIMFIILTSLILLGVVASYIIAKRIYHPLNMLINDVKLKKGIDLKDDESEMALLSRAFTLIATQKEDLQDILEKNNITLKEKYIMNLLKGDIERCTSLSHIQLDFPYQYFTCSILSIDKYDEFAEKYSKEQQYYMKMLIMKLSEEVIREEYKCESIMYDINKMVIITNFSEEALKNHLDNLKTFYLKVQEEIKKVIDNTVTITIGGCHSYKEEISLSFNEALETLKGKLFYGYGKITAYSDITLKQNSYYYPSNIEKHIENNLKLNLRDETLSAVRELIADMMDRPYIPSDNILQIFIQLVGNTLKYLTDSNINISDIFGHEFNIYQSLTSKETLEEIQSWLLKFYSKILDYINKNESPDKDHSNKVFEFIKNNLKNNIDVTAIADYAGISYSYVRKIVKDKSGKSVVDYINELRISEAKRLLKETNMNMSDIAINIGYNNYQSFNRFFQKYEGVTPGEFRNGKGVV